MPQNRILLVKGDAGLGNRVLALLTAILYAKLSGRELAVDWSDPVYSDGGRNVYPEYFESPRGIPPESIPRDAEAAPATWSGQLHDHIKELLLRNVPDRLRDIREWDNYRIDIGRLDHPELVAVFWSYYERIHSLRKHFRGSYSHFRRARTKEILREVMRDNLAIAAPIRKRVDSIRGCWPPGTSIGIHVRFTDKRSRLKALLRKLDSIVRKTADPVIFLATDSRRALKLVGERYPGILTTEKWLPDYNGPVHLDRGCPDRCESGAAALVDLSLLATCDHLVHDEGSSFAYVASLLADPAWSKVHDVNIARHMPSHLRHKLWAMRYSWKHYRRLWT